jgi:hypothetical protein
MIILAHRGYWEDISEKNSESSIKKAFDEGYGIESDVRDFNKNLVISHDPADNTSIDAERIFSYLSNFKNKFCFAINIKADGLADDLLKLLRKYNIKNYFCFDMSIPQMIYYCEKEMNVFCRQSEYEKEPMVLYEKAQGVWIDAFDDDSWITEDLILNHIKNGKEICIVSPELHSLPHLKFWEKLKMFNVDYSKIMLCTDLPNEADQFFNLEG